MNEQAQQTISLTLVRTIDAPPADVFDAWTDPVVLRQWMAPGAVEVDDARSDARVGGEFCVRMRTPGGENPTTRGVFREVVPHTRIAFTWQWDGSDVESLVTVALRALEDGRTELTLTHERFRDDEMRDKHGEGWNGCLAKLEARFSA